MQNSLALTDETELVMLRFQFSNASAVPKWVPRKETESSEQKMTRESRPPTGVKFLEHSGNTRVDVVTGLERAGFQLVGAHCETRKHTKPESEYYVAVYTFARQLQGAVHQGFLESRASILQELRQICQGTFWQKVQGYKNPLYRAGATVPGKSAVVIGCSARVCTIDDKGSPILV